MSQYPSYYPQMNNNNYGQQYNPQQPYIDRLNQLQQYQQNLQMPPTQMSGTSQQFQQIPVGINGKIVPNVENIAANDVPMDGSVAFFPKQDMSEVYAKSWNADGTIKTVIYRPFVENPINSPQAQEKLEIGLSEDVTEAFMSKFNELSDKIDRLEQYMNKPATRNTSSRGKKEADSE